MKYNHIFAHLLKEYLHKDKEIIFLVNEDVSHRKNLDKRIKFDIKDIFFTHIEDPDSELKASKTGNRRPAIFAKDKISLMSYGKNVKKLFNLTSINENLTQLLNQIP